MSYTILTIKNSFCNALAGTVGYNVNIACDSEHQELVKQIDETSKRGLHDDLERELDCLVKRMEEKAAQISELRKHQQTVSSYFVIAEITHYTFNSFCNSI